MAKSAAAVAAPPETPNGAAASVTPIGEAEDADPNKAVIEIVWRGVTVTVPKRRGRWDIDALVDFQDGKPLPGLRRLLGQNQWARIKSVGPTGDDLNEFSGVAADAINDNCVP